MKKIYKLKIKSNQNEYWYGGLVSDGVKMPYYAPQEAIDLSKENHLNQAASLFVSTYGRYVYSQYPFKYCIKNKILIIESKNEIKIKEAKEKTLKSAIKTINEKYILKDHNKINNLSFEVIQYNTWMEMGYDSNEEKVLKFVQDIVDNEYPSGLIIIDDSWQKSYGTWEFDKNRFPTPKKMIEKIHNSGFKVSLWICPFVSADSTIYRELSAQGFLIKGIDGKTKIIKWWNGYSACLDLTNPKTCAWLTNVLKKLQKEYGVNGFKFDAGDFEFYRDAVFYDESEPSSQSKHLVELASQFESSEVRVAYNNQDKYVIQKQAKKNHTWKNDGLNAVIQDALAASILGYKIICPDSVGGSNLIEGNKAKLDQELFIRYSQVAAFFPIIQFSLLPWNILSKTNCEIVKQAVEIHQKLIPYIKEIVKQSFETGDPVIRSLEYEYPHCGYEFENEAFMLGDKYIVVPMIGKGKTHKIFRLPQGEWKDENGKVIVGGKNVPVNSPINTISYFEKNIEVVEQKKKNTKKKTIEN